MRKRWFHIVLVEKDFTVEVRDRLCSSHFIHKWAYVRHIDADMCPHYHVYVEFGCSAYEGAFLAEKLGIEEHSVFPAFGRRRTFLEYLNRMNESKIVSNFNIPDYIEFLTHCG